MSTESVPPMTGTWEQESARIYRERVTAVVRRLNDLAADFEREALRIGDATEAHTHAAARGVHALIWGVANTSADSIINAAVDADNARREARQ